MRSGIAVPSRYRSGGLCGPEVRSGANVSSCFCGEGFCSPRSLAVVFRLRGNLSLWPVSNK
eukprot:5395868-Alexandrium_andersonii.AAC.1